MKVIIIGSGLLGITTAWYLVEQGIEVTVIDRQPGPGLETSFGNAGILHVSQAEPWNRPGIVRQLPGMLMQRQGALAMRLHALPSLIGWGMQFLRNSTEQRFLQNIRKNTDLALYSLREMQALRDNIGLSYRQSERGTITVFDNREDRDRSLEFFGKPGLHDISIELLDPSRVLEREPALHGMAPGIAAGLYYPQDEIGDSYLFCTQLLQSAAARGVTLQFNTEVRGLTVKHGSIRAVRTSSGEYTADTVVLAAGSYSPLLASTAGIAVPVRPVKGCSITATFRETATRPVHAVIDHASHVAMTPLGDELRVTGLAEFCGYDTRPDVAVTKRLLGCAAQAYPGHFAQLQPADVRAWTGLRPYSCDGVPIIGATSLSNLYMNTGHGHLGWTMAAGSGKLLADYMLGRDTALEMTAYSIARF